MKMYVEKFWTIKIFNLKALNKANA